MVVSEAQIKMFSAREAITIGEARARLQQREIQRQQLQQQQQQQLAEQQRTATIQTEIDKTRQALQRLEAESQRAMEQLLKFERGEVRQVDRSKLPTEPAVRERRRELLKTISGLKEGLVAGATLTEAKRFATAVAREAAQAAARERVSPRVVIGKRFRFEERVMPAEEIGRPGVGVMVVPTRDERVTGVVEAAPTFIESALGFGRGLIREPVETIKGIPELLKRRIEEPGLEALEAVERGIRAGAEPVLEPFVTAVRRAGEVEAAMGRREFFAGREGLLPFEVRGTAVVTKVEPLTQEELGALPFGAGAKEIVRRTQQTIKNIELQEAERARRRQKEEVSRIESRVEKGELTVEEANKEIEELNVELQKEFEKSFAEKAGVIATETEEFLVEAARGRRIGEAVLLAAPTFALGLGFGVGAALLPTAIGTTGGIFFGVSAALQTPELLRELKEAPLQTAGSLLISGAAFGAGAAIGGRIAGRPVEDVKIRQALDRATTRQAFRQENVDFGGIAKRYALTPAQQSRLKVLLDKGVGARIVETELVASTSLDAKILPKIRSVIVDILSADGRVVERISIGRFIVKQKGKVFTRDILAESIGKVDKGGAELATTVLEGKFKGKAGAKFKALKETRLLEEFEIGEIRKVSELERLVTGETRTKLITERPIREIGSATELLAGRRLITRKPTLSGVEELLRQRRKVAGKLLSRSDLIAREKILEFAAETRPIGIESPMGRVTFGETGAFARRTDVSGIAVSQRISPKVRGRTLKTPTRFEISKIAEETTPGLIPKRSVLEQSGLTKTTLDLPKAVPTLDVASLLGSFAREVTMIKPRVRSFLVTLLGTGEKEKIDVTARTKLSTSQIEEQQEAEKQTLGQFSAGVLASSAVEETRLGERQLLSPITATTTQLQQRLQQRPVSVTPFAPVAPFTPEPPTAPRQLMLRLIRDEAKKKKVFGYHGFAKHGKEFIRVTEKPTSKLNAMSRAARVVDHSSSRQLKVTKLKKKIKKPKKRDLYALDNINKFRFFKQVKGKKVSLGNKAIERTEFAIDTKGERQQITAKGILASMRKARMPKPRVPRRVPRRAKVRNLLGF
jgi:hypothetical protein